MKATYTLNAEKNGVEIRFDARPAAEVLESIKAAGYRWSRARRLWWARQNPETLEAAQAVAEGRQIDQAPSTEAPSLWERVQWTPGPGGDDCHAHTVGSNYKRGLANREIAATVKRELTRRFPRCRWSATSAGYNSVNVYLLAAPYYNAQGAESRREWAEQSPELAAVMSYARALLESYNYDDGDSMTDYYDVNFYGTAEIAYRYQQTPQTDGDRAEIARFRADMQAAREAEEAEEAQHLEEEQARRAAEYAEAQRRDAEARAIVDQLQAAAQVRDLDEAARYVIPAAPLARKAATLDEAREHADSPTDCIITREIIAPRDLLDQYGARALSYDAPALYQGTGGTWTPDRRVNSRLDYDNMSKAERQYVRWYTLAAAIYTDAGDLWAVVDAEGYNYARYIAPAPWADSDAREFAPEPQATDPEAVRAAQLLEDTSTAAIEALDLIGGGWETSEEYAQAMEPALEALTPETIQAVTVESLKAWLYRRHAERQRVRPQLERAAIPQGERVTILQESALGGVSTTWATWERWETCVYAQHNDAARIIVRPYRKRGLYSMTLHNGPALLIVAGYVTIPEPILWEVVPTSIPGATARKSRYSACDPAAFAAVREYVQSTGARLYVDVPGTY